ncbi:MAG: DUF1343 domain-containing protein [Candidatus Sericytochromatia bacterium]|nr:DUF1343 domain-containing protein [Candidatus Sericytochromatia bacterium]
MGLGLGIVLASGALRGSVLQACATSIGQIPSLRIRTGADQPSRYLPLLKGRKVGLVANPSSRVGKQHLLDYLLQNKVLVKKVFAPEHGFRGEAEAGAQIVDGKDPITQLPVLSLYGDQKQPSPEALKEMDLLVFDIQDVGVRYYTYISTLHYVMEACAQSGKPLIVLDRPNPNGAFVDGPLLEPALRSFVGLHPIPLLHGLTVGELAQMINGEKWLKNGVCALTVVPVASYSHSSPYSLPVPPSPNLPNAQAVRLYPSLGLFEGTGISVGRGTDFPFQVIGQPDPATGPFQFTPVSLPGKAQHPMFENQLCYGWDLRSVPAGGLNLDFLIGLYHQSSQPATFFNPFFDKLAGTAQLRTAIQAGQSEAQIRESWQAGLQAYKTLRQKYLLYPD